MQGKADGKVIVLHDDRNAEAVDIARGQGVGIGLLHIDLVEQAARRHVGIAHARGIVVRLVRQIACNDALGKRPGNAVLCGAAGDVRVHARAADIFTDPVDDQKIEFFIRNSEELRRRIRQVKPSAILIGEVWEDASNKIAYDRRRRYFVDNELDGVMNYPLQKAILRYVRRENDGAEFGQQVMTLAENYPPHVLNACMNLLSTHDTPRAINALLDPHDGSRDDLARRHFSPDQIIWGKELLRTAAFLQFTLPGAPCIYYGDEAGMTGYRDPFNRGFYPWGEEDTNLQAFYRALARLKRENPALKTGRVEFITASNGRVQFLRQSAGQTAMVFCNASREPWRVQYAGKLLFGGKLQAYTPEAVTLGENGFCVMV